MPARRWCGTGHPPPCPAGPSTAEALLTLVRTLPSTSAGNGATAPAALREGDEPITQRGGTGRPHRHAAVPPTPATGDW